MIEILPETYRFYWKHYKQMFFIKSKEVLQHHWNSHLTRLIEKEDSVIDLLPQVHRKAYTPSMNVTPVDFLVLSKGRKTAAGHFGKAVKGEFIRYIAQNKIIDIDDFGGFEYDGFKWDGTSFIKEKR